MVKFENCVHQMNAQKPNVPTNINDFYVDNLSLFPTMSLFLKNRALVKSTTEDAAKNNATAADERLKGAMDKVYPS